jgi:hypothetical protein
MRFLVSCLLCLQTALFCQNEPSRLRAFIIQDAPLNIVKKSCSNTKLSKSDHKKRKKNSKQHTTKHKKRNPGTAHPKNDGKKVPQIFQERWMKIRNACEKFAKTLGIEFVPTMVKMDEFSQQNLKSWIASIDSSTDDTAVFYYSGRGEQKLKPSPFYRNPLYSSLATYDLEIPFAKEGFILDSSIEKQIENRDPACGVILMRGWQSRHSSYIRRIHFGEPTGAGKEKFDKWLSELFTILKETV